MVRLKVTARVIPEDAYLSAADPHSSSLLPGEKRLLVVVSNPELWLIGQLANEINESYKRTYKRCVQRTSPNFKNNFSPRLSLTSPRY